MAGLKSSDDIQNECNMSIIIESTAESLTECDIDSLQNFINSIKLHNQIKSQKLRKKSETKIISRNIVENIVNHLRLSDQRESNFNSGSIIFFNLNI